MKHSIIINTACGDAQVAGLRNPYRSARYGQRAALLSEEIIPRLMKAGFDEIIIAGVWPQALPDSAPADIIWVNVPPQRHNRWDGLLQRENGARFATGDTLTFCHDDHAPGDGYAYQLDEHKDWDILVPRRLHAATGAELNNGKADGYMGGHCYTMRRWAWAALPLTSAPDEWWDIYLSPRWRALGASIVYSDTLLHYDLEATPDET